MALAHPPGPERGPSPLSSNNPFRNRAASPTNAVPASTSPPLGLSFDRPVSTNPFLDVSELQSSPPAPSSNMAVTNGRTSPTKPLLSGNAAELFEALSLDDKPSQTNGPSRSRTENVPPRPSGPLASKPPPYRHRPSGSREDDKQRNGSKSRPAKGELDIFADPASPPKRREPRARRNSDTSVIDRASKLLDPEDEKRRRERRHREKEARHRAKGKPSRRLDVIDKLDVTSIYGTGLVHHDGPFDACNPHRNRKGSRAAPMQAFAKDSKNMSLGGAGPLRSKIDLAQYNGMEQEGYRDFARSTPGDDYYGDAFKRPGVDRSVSFNPTSRIEQVHGDESMGLGTSTFLEGAPASRVAIQRRESEQEAALAVQGGGLSRKKSLAQKIRGNLNQRIPGPRVQSPEERTTSPTSPISGGGAKKANENNPFFQDYDQEYDKKGAKIQVAEEENNFKPRARAPSSPRRGLGLERKATNDSTGLGSGEDGKVGGGFLSRVKSLKGGRRTRPERRDVSE